MEKKRYRVAQWATGVTGAAALKAVILHPQYDLVAVKVYTPTKVGKDAGELCDQPSTGILATMDIADVIAGKPDCVLYMPHETDFDEVVALLAAGINVVTTRWEFNHRDTLDPAVRARLDAACENGQSSLYPTGSTPGFATEIMPFALTSIMRRIDCITISDSSGPMAIRGSPDMLTLIGMGRDPADIPDDEPHVTALTTPPTLRMTAEALSLEFDEIKATRAYAVARNDVHIVGGWTLKAGTVAAQRMEIACLKNGKPVLRRRTDWWVTDDIEPHWDLRPRGWHWLYEGDVPLDITISYPVSNAEWPNVVGPLGANNAVNAIPYLVEAAPGLRHTNELPQMIGNFGPKAA